MATGFVALPGQSTEMSCILGNWLHVAVARCTVDVAERLISKGEDVSRQSSVMPHGTPLGRAIMFENLEVARVLLENGADPNNNTDRCTISPVNGQKKKKRPLEALQLLLEFGADLNKQYKHHGTGFPINALSMAIDSNLKEVVQFLEANGCTMPTPIEE